MHERDSTRTRSASGGDAAGVARVFQLAVVAAPTLVDTVFVTLDHRTLTLGRGPSGERALTVDDEQASRSHAEVAYDAAADAYAIRDLGSRNGVFVDGEPVQSAPLRHGTVVRIGRSLLVCSDRLLAADAPLSSQPSPLQGIGLSMQRLRGDIERVAPHALPVLVLGETGTGKELVARELHRLSGRTGPLVAVNCAAIPEALAESELFGHTAGAFTGATQRTEGFFASADGGTLFLDEVAELPAAVQSKLLRALGAGEVRALGRTETRKVDVRVVAATHRDVSIDAGFREDLLGRLAGWSMRVPPLRERREDILWLASVFARRGSPPASLTTSAAEALLLYSWPRNVRQLEMVIAAAAVRAGQGRAIRPDDLPDAIPVVRERRETGRPSGPPLALLVPRDRVPSPSDLRVVLERFDHNVARVADYFGKDRKQVYRWIQRAGLARAVKEPSVR